MVLPEPAGKFSASFYMPIEGLGSFEAMKASGELLPFIKERFRGIYEAVPDFEE